MSLSPFDSFQSRFVTFLLNRPRTKQCKTEWVPTVFRNTLLHVVHSSSYGRDDGRGLTETCCPIEIT